MKNKYLIFLILSLSILTIMSFNHSNKKFYYAYGEKIYLNELDNKLIVRYKQNKQSDETKISLYSELFDKQIEWKDDSTCIITFDAFEIKLFKEKILMQNDVKSCNTLYSINTGLEMGVTDEFLAKFNENVSITEIEKLHKIYGVEVVKTTDIYQLIKVPNGSDALEIANKYQESGLTRFSHPNFICEIELHQVIPNDPYFVNQFSLHNTGQVFTDGHFGTNDADIDAPTAWSMTKGNNNIIIAVLDQGLTPDHPDLPNTRQVRLNGSNFADGDPNNPSPTGDNNHGNACAGIIGATQNNNQGISGIAPNCRIMPIRIFGGAGITPQRVADAINFAKQNGAHIISNSWGYNSDNPNLYPVIRDAIIAATSQGRNGLGCIVVFSAGNTANRVIGNNGYICFPANVNIAGVLTIGASDRDDLQANYSPTSNPGSPNNQIIDIVAPSHRAYSCQIPTETFEAWSIDIPNNNGYNPVHTNDCGALPGIGTILPNAGVNNLSYTGRFGGTSYSCPQVAGVSALLLSINPNLSQLQVFDILTTTADRVGGYVYTDGRSNELGFGRLNACRAVTQAFATVLTISGPTAVCTSGSTFTVYNLPTGCSTYWTWSSNLQAYNGGSNFISLRAIGSGSGWVRTTINSFCDQAVLPQKDVWVGAPSTPTSILGFCCNGMEFGSESIYDFTVNHANNQGVNQYNWVVAGGTILEGQGTKTITVKTAKAVTVRIYFDVSIRVGNSCGWSSYLWRTGYVVPGEVGPEMFTINPNPANSEITISLSDVTSLVDATVNNENVAITNIKIVDSFGNIKKIIKYESGQKSVTINVSDLQNGIYLIVINYGLTEESHTLIIE